MKTLWFKRKTYGWGWTPVSWQGWALTLLYVGILVALGIAVQWGNTKEVALLFLLPFVILTTLFIRIYYKTGERPRWQWGSKK